MKFLESSLLEVLEVALMRAATAPQSSVWVVYKSLILC